MEAIFLKLLNMSITATWLILGAIAVRLLLKKAPKYLRFIAWALVGVRLLLPISLESALSLIPSAEPIPQEILTSPTPQIHSGINAVNQFINPIITEALTPSEPAAIPSVQAATPMQTLTHVASIVWLCGMVLMLGYALISYLILRRRVSASICNERGVYVCDDIDSPFVLGILKPRIYLPSMLDSRQTEHVVAHERAHVRRRDHWWKPLAFALLSVYWFNPMIWVAYVLLCRDIELACDERVARNMSDEEKAAYSSSLLELSLPRKMITACPVAFGEVGVKDRIKSVLSYKKPTLWIIIAALVACTVLAVTLLTDPVEKDEKDEPKQEEKEEKTALEWDKKYVASKTKDAIAPYFCLNEKKQSYTFVYSGFSSHISMGSYSLIDDDLLLLEEETENEYVFRKTEDGYVFDASKSSPMPEYKYSADSEPEVCIEDGTLFYLKPVESYPTSGEYWSVDYNNDGTYNYNVFGKDDSRIFNEKNVILQPEFSLVGENVLRVGKNEEANYINLETGHYNGFYRIVCENEKAMRYAFIDGYSVENLFIYICDMADNSRYFVRVPLLDCNGNLENDIKGAMSDDGTVDLSYITIDGQTKEIVIDDNTLNCVNLYRFAGNEPGLFTRERALTVSSEKESYEYVVVYNEKEASFKSTVLPGNAYHRGDCYSSEDITGDGIDDVIVKLPTGWGTGICSYEIHVFDGKTLKEYPVESIYDIVPANVKTSNDDKAYYIEFNGDKYIFNYADMDGITVESFIGTDGWNDFDVSDGKLICDTACQVITWPLATIRTEYRFDGEKFVFDGMTIEPHEEYTLEDKNAPAESTPDTAASARPSPAPETNANANSNTNTNININTNINEDADESAPADDQNGGVSFVSTRPGPTSAQERPDGDDEWRSGITMTFMIDGKIPADAFPAAEIKDSGNDSNEESNDESDPSDALIYMQP